MFKKINVKKIVSFTATFTVLTLILFHVSACTESKRAEMTRLGKSAVIQVFSHSAKVYEGTSTGKLLKKEGGYLFKEKGTEDTIQILGENTTYIIRYTD